jgi:signal transduction histidine kinase
MPVAAILIENAAGCRNVLDRMRRETDFVLEKAAWPALLLEENGRICRANQAARHVFGFTDQFLATSISAIWDEDSGIQPLQFLEQRAAEGTAPVKMRLHGGQKAPFIAHVARLAREEQNYFVLQLFKESGSSFPELASIPVVTVKAPPSLPPIPPPPPEKIDEPVAVPGKGVEANLAHKQKLDCALQLARSVALDFNNALTTILGHTSLLLSKAEAGNPWRGSLVEIEKSAARAAEIANDLAAFSRQDKDVRVQVAGNLNLLLERTVDALQGSLQQPITISRQLERKLFTANFDEAKMQQALVKLFENAVEAIAGAGKITVQTRNLELAETTQDQTARLNPGNYVCLEISDTGSGIAPDVLPRVFEPFFTTKGAGHRGLGLAWVYGIVTNHGGGVAVSNRSPVGTAVRIYLPATSKIVREAAVSDGDLHGTANVLLVDDEELLLTMGQMVLSSYGYTVLTANSGQKALELFTKSSKPIDLVITDLVMPNMSGRELSEQILQAAPGTRIIWSSGYVRSANSPEQETYLQKPFTSQDLLRKVKQVLAH